MDEDAIDTEALQAKIDLSMSFAQNLISSWIQPYKIPKNPYKRDLEKELSEYMQRPARLGVGASIPEGYNSASREIARLKGKLAGTKHSREDVTIAPEQLLDSEGESKATAIKKRPKYDPFDVVHGKKKKKSKDMDHEDTNSQPITANPSITQIQALKEADDPYLDGSEPNSPTPLSHSKKKNRKKIKAEKDVEGCEAGTSSTLLFNGSSDGLNPPSTPPRSANIDTTPQNQRIMDVSLTSTPTLIIQTPHKSIPANLLKIPLLNLNGPHSDHDSNHEGTPPGSTKRKRKRRRKKNTLISSASDGKIDETGDVSPSRK